MYVEIKTEKIKFKTVVADRKLKVVTATKKRNKNKLLIFLETQSGLYKKEMHILCIIKDTKRTTCDRISKR